METGHYDTLTSSRVFRSERPIFAAEELRGLGIALDDAEGWGIRAPRRTDQFCSAIVTHPRAGLGQIARMEVYQNRNLPHYCICILYREMVREGVGRVVENQFLTNDPGYLGRRGLDNGYRQPTSEEFHQALQ